MNTKEINPDLLPIELDERTLEFEVDGHKYFVEYNLKLSVIRSRWLERYGFVSILGRDPRQFISEVRRAYDFLNDSQPADAIVTLNNLMQGGAGVMGRPKPMLQICTLFINREDEDRAGYDESFAEQKINAWGRINESFFLRLALGYLKITDEHARALIAISLSAQLPNLDPLSQPMSLNERLTSEESS